jgi:hypothetical protein
MDKGSLGDAVRCGSNAFQRKKWHCSVSFGIILALDSRDIAREGEGERS